MREYGDMETTFFVTGIGPFKANLKQLGIENDDNCECNEVMTSKHVLRN